jgi:hypothetical protein
MLFLLFKLMLTQKSHMQVYFIIYKNLIIEDKKALERISS